MVVRGKAMAFCVLLGALGVTEAALASAPRTERTPAANHRASTASGSTGGQHRAAAARPGQRPAGHHQFRIAGHHQLRTAARLGGHAVGRRGRRFAGGYGGGLSCVPYARQVTGMTVSGNAYQWWGNSEGIYAHGQRPEAGSVLTFRASGGMSRGHVAVVSRVVSARHVLIDHSNWGGPGIRRGTVIHGAHVVDVSENNDWSAVRVQVGHADDAFGRTYPTYGFIYNRPDSNVAYAGMPLRRTTAVLEQLAEAPEPLPALNAEPRRRHAAAHVTPLRRSARSAR